MREIKFRGKHKNPYGDKWVRGYYAMKDGRHVIVMPHADNYISSLNERKPIPPISVEHTIDANTLGQYTGLKDKNGVEIYEGDIVYVASEDENAKIVWCSEMCKFALEFESEWASDFDSYYGKDLEVMGNIYDN